VEQNLSLDKPILKIDWCSYEAAKYAVEHWHYSKKMPKSKSIYLGVWENAKFIGAIVFGLGGGAATNGTQYGLASCFEIAELERIALTKHKSFISRIVAIAVKFLRIQSPNLKMLISYADPEQGHHGGIYQALGWIYVGKTKPDWAVIDKSGRRWHSRVASASGMKTQYGKKVIAPRPQDGKKIILPGKYKYLYPLNNEIRKQIKPLQKPYPKRAVSKDAVAPEVHSGEGGSIPTTALQTPPIV